jgi:hypothetical protein
MIPKAEFIALARRGNPSLTGAEPEFETYEEAAEAAEKALKAMPGIGFASIKKRFNAFVTVCWHLDAMVERGEECSSSDAQLAILILRMSNKPFMKAAIAFDIQGPKLRTNDLVDLPSSAREYLAGVKLYG